MGIRFRPIARKKGGNEMRAKIKATGEIIELNEQGISLFEYARGIYKDVNGNKYMGNELEFIEENPEKDIDWEKRRYEIAKDILAATYDYPMGGKPYAKIAVGIADALIAELKKHFL